MVASIQMGLEHLTQFISIGEFSCVFVLVGGGGRLECREDLAWLSPSWLLMANKLFLVLICAPNVGCHRYCLVSSSLHGLRVQYLNKAWI